MGAAEKLTYTFAEYLAFEAESDVKYEYHDGYLVAMAGGTLAHAQIASNLSGALFNGLGNKDCIAYSSDAKVAIVEVNTYLYPDATVVCGPVETPDGRPHTIANPKLVVEVISETSEAYDRGEKFRLYRGIPSLQQYVLIWQSAPRIETYCRSSDGFWLFSDADGIDKTLHLQSLDITLRLEEIYRKVVFEKK